MDYTFFERTDLFTFFFLNSFEKILLLFIVFMYLMMKQLIFVFNLFVFHFIYSTVYIILFSSIYTHYHFGRTIAILFLFNFFVFFF